MPAFIRAISAVLTAMAVCIGSERGTTEVTMITHLSSSSCVVRSPFSSPAAMRRGVARARCGA
eukprot:2059014-Prymnesium_polylepis.1